MACDGFVWKNQDAAVAGWLASFDGATGTLVLEFGVDPDGGEIGAAGFVISPAITIDSVAPPLVTFLNVPPGEYLFTGYSANGCPADGLINLGFGIRYAPIGAWAKTTTVPYFEAPDDPADAVVSRTLRPGFPPTHPIAIADPSLTQGTYPTVDLRATNRGGGGLFDIATYCRARLVSTREPQPEDPSGRLWAARLGFGNATDYFLDSGLSLNQLLGLANGPYLLSPFRALLPYWGAVWGYRTYYLQYQHTYELYTIRMIDVDNTIEVSFEDGSDSTSIPTVSMPCPTYPLPICWLSPEGGEGFWIFSARHTYSLSVDEGETYFDVNNTERILSRGDVRDVVSVESGYLPDPALYEGLRTIYSTPQAWAYVGNYTTAEGEWRPIIIEGGEYVDYRSGEKQRQVALRFRFADPIPIQGS
jgi:hypothetical protein